MSFTEKSRKSWIEETIFKRECVKFIPSSRDLHRCIPVCQVCQNLIRCCCGHLMGEHSWQESLPPISLYPGPGQDLEEDWSIELHTKASPTNAYGTIDFQDTATRVCRAKYVRVAVDSKPEVLLQLMLKEWQMERPKLLLTVQGGSENFTLPLKVEQAFSKGLITAALSTGAWILTDGINTGVSKYVGEAVKTFGGHNLRKRNTVGITPWGVIDNNTDLIGRDVFRPYQPLGNPLSKQARLNGFHSHFLLVDDGTLGKHGCQQGLRGKLEKHIRLQKIHPRLNQGVPVVCVVLEGGPAIVSTVLDYVSNVPPVPVFVFEGSGRAADLLAFLHKQTAIDRQLDTDIKEDFLVRIGNVFGVDIAEASQLYSLLLQCMNHRQSITIFDSESEDQTAPDAAILTTSLKGTKASPAEQLSMALAWDRADIAQKDVLVYGQHWQVGSLEQAMLDALVMDRVSFVKLLIDNGMTMNRFLTVDRLEDLYNTTQGQTDRFLHHLVEDAKQTSLPIGYRLSLIDMGLVIEYLIGGAYRSTYTRKHFRAAYSRQKDKEGRRDSSASFSRQRRGLIPNPTRVKTLQNQYFFRTAQPYKPKEQDVSPGSSREIPSSHGLGDAPLLVTFNFNDLFVWAVLQQRQQMALFLWQHGEEALARATVACKLYRSMAIEVRQSSMDDNISERFKTYSLEFGQLAVDALDCAFRQNEQMAMKLLTIEMEAWSHFTCLQMAVSSCHRPFVSHSCTQTLLTDLWTGSLNMRKNSYLKIILSLLLPPAILLLEFKSKAEMCHVPQSHEAMPFGLESVKTAPAHEGTDHTDAERRTSFDDTCFGPVSDTVSSITVQCLSWITRVYEFYTAPVVKFWFHTMSYLAFLMLFSFVVLVKMGDRPSVQEWLVIAYILSTAVEKTREVLMSEPRKLSQKLKIWFSEYWNVSDFIAILLFLAGLALRWHADPYRRAGRISYCLDIIFWFVRVTDLLAVNQHAGPYLTMITKMTKNMFFIVVMMAIVLLSFGVSRKAILSPDEEPSWSLARDVVFEPYWMIYGEVYAKEIDPCDDGVPCPPASFLTAFLQAVYLFFQYIIMVNILIAFFNNVYFDMESSSNKLWKYNRYRYIMTYQERPWLPPPLILLSHMTSSLRTIYRRCIGDAEQEERGSGLKLNLGHEDRKKLHEFEEKCVEAYFHEKSDDLHSSQINRIRATAERVEEMYMMMGEVSEKVIFIQDSLSELDCQLGRLQDLSALAVDTLTLLSASDSLHQEEARLSQCRPITASRHILPHSWTLPHRSRADCDALNMRRVIPKSCKSTPPSLLKGYTLVASRLASQECHVGAWGSQGGRRGHTEEGEDGAKEDPQFRDQTPCESCGQSRCGSPLSPRGMDSPHHKLWTCEPYLYPSQEETSMEEGEEEEVEEEREQEEERIHKQLSDTEVSRTSSDAVLLSDPRDISEGLVNPAFSHDDSQPSSRSRPSSQWERPVKSPRWAYLSRDRPYGYCRSLSCSVENMAFSGTPLSPMRGSFPSLNEPMNKESLSDGRGFRDDTSLRCSRSREWSKSSDFTQVSDSRGKNHNRKTVKIQESSPDTATTQSHLSDACWRRWRRLRGEPTCWSASTSLNQLNFEPMDLLQKQVFPHQDVYSPTHSAWNSWARSMSHRSSLQSGIAPEAKSSSFQSTDNLYPHYSAVERNNLMRLAHTIPFTPVSILGGEEVSIYSLEEVPSDADPESGPVSSWSSRGLSAMLQPLSSEEGSLDGGLRRGCRVLCTWAERDVLRPGLVYVVKAFRPEVVRAWQRYFHGSTAQQLCLREIQQQKAAQKMMQEFNEVIPDDMHHSPRFLDVALVLWHSNGQWLTIERNMSGDFRKYNNNTGEEITPCCSLEEMLLAFSHWTYEFSCRELVVLDIQGVGEELTDPTVIMADDQSGSRGEMLFGPDNLGDAGISGFLQKHSCGACCRRLGLADFSNKSNQIIHAGCVDFLPGLFEDVSGRLREQQRGGRADVGERRTRRR
ncbi:transient receptor potential cation channel subfamily M member 6 isoform X1 [Sebastes umbrosus]|uniref:transient receptor potential cation channel subfamily M member 6 isoform X1 n=1 Tax=Sebastes umbrosus TaxID=72105 RepID=UPI00189CBA61|nr:transient receptor potential cation channel subfamily M member 6 isoform X1 [Sebastes umbrosus]XP_037633259.1 transient receptor potential cation channel subfamily M member 6 isoform X1 [Sebastes umbrosus]